MKKTSQIVSVLLLVLSLAACNNSNKGESQTTAGGGEIQEYPGGWKPTTNYKNNVTISLANVQTIEGYDYSNGDDFAKWWAKAFNVKLEITSMTFDNWAERLRIWVSSGDMPDVCIFDYKHPDAAIWVDQGLLKEVPKGWKQRWPNLARVFGKTTLGPQMEKIFGGTYFLPRSRFDVNLPHEPLPDHCSFFFRKDWAEAIGFPIKDVYKSSEIIEYGRLVKEKDPGNLGAKLLPISSRPNWSMRLFVLSNFQHYITFYKDKDGVYKWGPASEQVLDGLKLWYKAYSTGVLNPEFYTVKDIEDYDQFRVSGVSGGYFGEATANHIYTARWSFQSNIGLDPYKNVGVSTVVGEDGYYHLEDLINYWGCHVFNPQISDEKLERWLDMLDFAATDAGYRLEQLGFEGTDWKWGANGELVSLLAEGQRLGNSGGKYPSISGNTIAGIKQGDDISFESPVRPIQDGNDSKRLYTDRSRLSTPETLEAIDWDLFCFDSPSMRKTNLDFQMEYSNLITSAKSEADLENLWRRWVQAQMPLIQPVLNELNTQLKK